MEQTRFDIPKEKKTINFQLKLDNADVTALARGMALVGETNKSSFIRRLIHEAKNRKV